MTTPITLFGIKNCDTVKKARKWLDENGVAYQFHDVRADGLDNQQVQQWAEQVGWETLLNRRSTTWKQLDSNVRDSIDATSAITQMVEHPTLIKRPVLATGEQVTVGFKADNYQQIFN